jgi:DNA-binding response OmpR family regulator
MAADALRKILYVEDDPDIREIARLSLGTFGGFDVEICGTGEEAIERFPAFRPELVLLDAMMPGLDGPHTLHALRGLPEWNAAPVIFLTASTAEEEIRRFKRIGALEVIAKPFDPIGLPETIRLIWASHREAT